MDIIKKTATLALIVRDGQVLLGHKVRKGADIGEGTLNGPGGKLDPGQSLETCLVEEVRDEVGIEIDPAYAASAKAAVVTFHNGNSLVWEVHVYLIQSFAGEPYDTVEMVRPEHGWWYSFDRLPFDRLLASDAVWMPMLGPCRFRR